jgi:hypothetical protein
MSQKRVSVIGKAAYHKNSVGDPSKAGLESARQMIERPWNGTRGGLMLT